MVARGFTGNLTTPPTARWTHPPPRETLTLAMVGKGLAAQIMERDNFTCVYCGRGFASLPKGTGLSIDHVTPESWFANRPLPGTADDPRNLVTACTHCNSLKRDMDLVVFALYLKRAYGFETEAMVARVRASTRRPLPE